MTGTNGTQTATARNTNDRRNIILVSMDSLRGDHCGFLGSDHELTPTMDRLASEGVSFQNAIAPGPQTFSSMPAVFTGHHRADEAVDAYPGESHWQRRLAAINSHLRRYPTLPERLQQLGYSTAGITPNPWTSTASGFDRGFDQFVDLSNQDGSRLADLAGRLPGVDTDDRAVKLAVNMVVGGSFFAKWDDLYERIQSVRKQLSEPYFLWVFLLDTHFPFLASRAHREEQSLPGMYSSAYRSEAQMRGRGDPGPMTASLEASVRQSYRDTVRASDAFLKRLCADFAADDPALIVHSDHGESLGEHGNYGHHHRKLYAENVHVPYLIHNAGLSAEITAPTSLTSLSKTAVELARTGTLTEPTPPEYVVAESECGTNRAVRSEWFKYVEHGDERCFFDRQQDPEEQTNVADQFPSKCAVGADVLQRFAQTRDETTKVQQTLKQLTAAGTV